MKNEELIQNLQNMLSAYDIILFLPCIKTKIVEIFSNCPKEQLQDKKILLLSQGDVPGLPDGIDRYRLDEESAAALLHLYHTYEFSNKFRVLSASGNFGIIWNYTETGILTAEEALAALLD